MPDPNQPPQDPRTTESPASESGLTLGSNPRKSSEAPGSNGSKPLSSVERSEIPPNLDLGGDGGRKSFVPPDDIGLEEEDEAEGIFERVIAKARSASDVIEASGASEDKRQAKSDKEALTMLLAMGVTYAVAWVWGEAAKPSDDLADDFASHAASIVNRHFKLPQGLSEDTIDIIAIVGSVGLWWKESKPAREAYIREQAEERARQAARSPQRVRLVREGEEGATAAQVFLAVPA